MELEVQQFKKLFGKDMPVFVDVYASRHSSLNETTPEYIERAMRAGKKASDGVLIYTHPDKQQAAAKFSTVKKLFHEWTDLERDRAKRGRHDSCLVTSAPPTCHSIAIKGVRMGTAN
jgi:hypothetical protein